MHSDRANRIDKDKYFPIIFFFLFLSASYPFSFGNLGPIPNFLWVEALAPLLLLFGCFQLIRKGQHPFPRGGRIFTSAICVLGFWAFVHYVLNPLSSQRLLGADKYGGGIRGYYTIFIGICVFFYAMWFSCYWSKYEFCWGKLLSSLILLSLVAGFSRLFTYLLGIEIPLLKGTFAYGELWLGKAHRIGGLSNAATLGISALLGLYYGKKWTVWFFIPLCSFIFLAIMSGGRSSSIGVLVAFMTYTLLFQRAKPMRSFFLPIIIIGAILLFFQIGVLKSQFGRITSLEGGFSKQDPGRYVVYRHMWKIFTDNPIMGKGIGYRSEDKRLPDFIARQLQRGGHGSYLSIMAIFGLGGIYFIVVILFGGIFKAFFYSWKSKVLTEDQTKMVVFVFMHMIILSFEFMAGGNGFENTRLFLLTGILAPITPQRRNET